MREETVKHWVGPMVQGDEMTIKVLFDDDLKVPGDGAEERGGWTCKRS